MAEAGCDAVKLDTIEFKSFLEQRTGEGDGACSVRPLYASDHGCRFRLVSGQTRERAGTSELVEGDIRAQTRQVLENIKNILAAAGCSIADVVKVSAHLADMGDFAGWEYFPKPYPARIAVQSVLAESVLGRNGRHSSQPRGPKGASHGMRRHLQKQSEPVRRPDSPNMHDVWAARKRISSLVSKTPLIKSLMLSEETGASVFLKLETVHQTGSFKIRGAVNKVLSLTPEEQRRGIATFSTGNHGLAVAYVAQRLGIPAVVCVSERVPPVKVEALRRLGASVRVYGQSQDDAEAYCYQLEKEQGLTVVKPFDDPWVIAGQGTIGLELLEDLPEIDTAIVPLSGGGLLAGIAMALKSNDPAIRVVGVSTARCAAMYESLRAGRPVVVPEEDRLADALLGGIGQDNRYTFRMVKEYVDEVALVSEEEIAEGMAYLFRRHRLVVEGAAATGVAALVHRKVAPPGSNIAIIISGNNVDLSAFCRVTQKYL